MSITFHLSECNFMEWDTLTSLETCETYLKNGEKVSIRRLESEDMDLCVEFIHDCSDNTLSTRFNHYLSKYKFDYEKWFNEVLNYELVFIALISQNGKKKIIGMVELIQGYAPNSCEYAIMVSDEMQNQSVGSVLTEYALLKVQNRQLGMIYALTDMGNKSMIRIFRKFGFTLEYQYKHHAIYAEKRFYVLSG